MLKFVLASKSREVRARGKALSFDLARVAQATQRTLFREYDQVEDMRV